MRRVVLLLALALGACAADGLEPVALQPGTPCAQCRMTVLDPKLTSQIVAPGEEPRFFDDLGCLANHLSANPPGVDARAFVADHRTGDWIDAARAVYTRSDSITTPMGSYFLAHADESSRAADPAAGGSPRVATAVVFGTAAVPGADR